MIRINLLPFRAARKRENIRRQVSVSALSVVLLLVVMGYLYLSLNKKVETLKIEKAEKTRELQSYAKTTKMIKEIKRKIQQMRAQLEVIKGLEKGKTGPVQLLDDIAMAVPKGKLWLKSLSDKKGILSMSGVAMDNETVALYMTNLEKTKSITSVDLKSTKLTSLTEAKLDVSDFGLTCKTYALKEKPEKKKQPRKRRKRK